MTERLFVQTDGVLSYAEIHDQVASGLSQLIGAGADGAAAVRTTHGSIAAAVDAALSGVLGTRQGTMRTTATSGTTIGEILKNAARLYDEGDLQGAEKLRAAAEAMTSGAGSSGGAGGTPAGGTGAASSGGEMVGQMLGQVGQQVGQLGQSLSGLTQGLQQIPQQVMQAVQQATQAAQSGAGEQGDDKAGEGTKEPQEPENSLHAGDHAPSAGSDHAHPQTEQPAGAAPGESPAAGPAPDVAPRPAPTRPAVDESAL